LVIGSQLLVIRPLQYKLTVNRDRITVNLLKKMFKFEDLRVYQEALLFIDLIYKLTDKWPKDELFYLSSQLRRAAISIALNIAEGTSRTKKDFRHFLDISRGSCYECVAIISIAKKRNYISESEYLELYELLDKIAKTTNALKNSLQ
jgi:four helix bundle protein